MYVAKGGFYGDRGADPTISGVVFLTSPAVRLSFLGHVCVLFFQGAALATGPVDCLTQRPGRTPMAEMKAVTIFKRPFSVLTKRGAF